MALVLAFLWAWGRYESAIEADYEKDYEPFPLPKNPQLSPQDVSIVVATIDTPETLPQSLCQWLSNNPREIIIVTIQRDLQHVQDLVAQFPLAGGITEIITCDVTNKREQLARGIRMARGKVIALVDDDAFWPTTMVLSFLLAGLENPEVGGAQGKQRQVQETARMANKISRTNSAPTSAYIPEHRLEGNQITGWEVAAIRCLEIQNRIQAVRFAADAGCFCLIGRTMLLRAHIIKDEEFLFAMCNDHWAGNKLSTGDDCFISRWMMDKGWKFCIQNAAEAEILTLVPNDRKLLLQNLRWKRSSFQSCLTILLRTPGFWRLIRTYPYTGRKLVERLFTPFITWIHIWAWIEAFRKSPLVGCIILLWYVRGWFKGYGSFVQKFPFCGKKIWAAILFDHCYPLLDLCGWGTLNSEGWLTRKD